MKAFFTILSVFFFQVVLSQTSITSKAYGELVFKELDYGVAKVKGGTTEQLSSSPTGTHGWLEDFEIVKVSDSVQAKQKANFGVVYIVNAKDTVDIDVVIEWIYPEKITNEKGDKFKSIKYTTKRPTNIPSASSYSLDEPYEIVKGNWQLNIYIEKKRVLSRTFILY